MKFKCESCGKPATVHLTEITNGQKIEKHLCEGCAATEGITIKANVPISQLLEDFILQSPSPEFPDQVCDVCGMSLAEFRKQGLLGCPHDYEVFADSLDPLLAKAHEGANRHIGKVPHRAGKDQKKMNTVLRMRAELKSAIAAEDYERAATLRDQIKQLEQE